MQRFKNVYKNGKRYKICFCENEKKNLYWPVVDGWTQHKDVFVGEENKEIISVRYFNDDKNFNIYFELIRTKDLFSEQTGTCFFRFWGKEKSEELKSVASIKSILKKTEKIYDEAKIDGIKKIPTFKNWKRAISDVEIMYSRKQNNRTLAIKISEINYFILSDSYVDANIGIYNDSYDNRVTELEYNVNGSRSKLKALISKLNTTYFKGE